MSYDGKIYGLMGKANEILTVKVVNTATLNVKKNETERYMPFFQEGPAHKVLVESYGKLYVVWKIYAEEYRPYEIQDFEVLKLDFSRKVWERVKTLGNRAFFLGPRCCTICCSASTKESGKGIMGNTICFTIAGDISLYAYNLEDKSISASDQKSIYQKCAIVVLLDQLNDADFSPLIDFFNANDSSEIEVVDDTFACMPNLVRLSRCETRVTNLWTTTAALSKLPSLVELRFQNCLRCNDTRPCTAIENIAFRNSSVDETIQQLLAGSVDDSLRLYNIKHMQPIVVDNCYNFEQLIS
ncbi:hypothetical protein LguiA_007515 [Lonicera macranthoides]